MCSRFVSYATWFSIASFRGHLLLKNSQYFLGLSIICNAFSNLLYKGICNHLSIPSTPPSSTPSIVPQQRKPPICKVYNYHPLTNDKRLVFWEVICWDFEVERCWSLSYTSGNIVVRTVARAEPSSKVTSLSDRYASQMCADTCIYVRITVVVKTC